MDSHKSPIVKEIVEAPEVYFSREGKSLEERIQSIKLSEEEETDIAAKPTKKVILDKALGLFKIAEIVNTMLQWNSKIYENIREAKKSYLLSSYFERTDRSEYAIIAIKQFLTNTQGNILFNKILRICDDSALDMELAGHLSSALKYIIDSDFIGMFEAHKYALSLIEKFTPRSLTIISDHRSWPIMQLGSYYSNEGRVTSDWFSEFTTAYSLKKGVSDKSIIEIMRCSIQELVKGGIIDANIIGADNNAKCVITAIGNLLLPYIDSIK